MGSSRVNVLIGAAISVAIVVAAVVVLRIDTIGKRGRGLNEEFTYDVSSFRQTKRDLVRFKEAHQFSTGLVEAGGIAVGPEDKIYVAGDQRVRLFDREGKHLSDISLAESATCLAVAVDGTVYLGVKNHLEVRDAQGKRKSLWKAISADALVTSVAVSKEDVFVADAGSRTVLRYDRGGKLSGSIGEKNPEKHAPGILLPSPYFDVAVAPDGLLRVQDPGRHRIETYTFDGEFKSAWGKASMKIEGFSGCCNPAHFAVFRDGKYVTTEKGLPRVKLYDEKGKFAAVVAGTDSFTNPTRPLAVAVDSQDRVLLLDPVQKAVRIFVKAQNPHS